MRSRRIPCLSLRGPKGRSNLAGSGQALRSCALRLLRQCFGTPPRNDVGSIPLFTSVSSHSAHRGLTLLEIVFSLTLVVFLVGAIFFLYVVSLRGQNQVGGRNDVHEKLHFALERVVRDVREAKALSVANHALRFTLREIGADSSYIYYLYNASDSWVPSYNQPTYDLYRAPLTAAGGVGISDDTFTYGSGDVIATDLLPPSTNTSVTSSGNYGVIKLGAKEGDDILTVRGNVRPRNV